MRVTSLLLAFLVITGSSTAPAATVADLAVVNVIRQTDPTLVRDKIVYRNTVSSDLDLVIAIASTAETWVDVGPSWFYWDESRKLGLFLQDKARPDRVYLLTLNAGSKEGDCTARIERATSTDTVISCAPEKGNESIYQKFVYDVRAKRLVSHFEYKPVAMLPVPDASGRTVFVGSDSQKLIVVELQPDKSPESQFLDKGEAVPWLARVRTNFGRVYLLPDESTPLRFGKPLPQSTYEELAKARPELVQNGYHPTIEEDMGPVQPEGDKFWFGKTFYDSEGVSGVGGFGYFDAADHQYHLFSPPEVADFSISAIRVEPDVVWMGIYHRGEYGDGAGGILRYDRKTHIVRKYDLPDIVNGLVVSRDRVFAGTGFGIAIIEGDQTRRYFVDRTTDGRLRIAEATR